MENVEERTFLVCNNVDCDARGSEAVLERLLQRVEEEDLPGVEVREYLCFSACEHGPNVVCVEDHVWYAGTQEEDADEIFESHMRDGEPVERLRAEGESLTESMIFASLDAGVLPGQM